MLYEYAVEPELLNSWERFRYLTEKFGVSQGRLISRFPKKWKRLVYHALQACPEIERKRIEERLTNIDSRMMKRTYDWDTELDWLANAEVEHGKRPFHAILASVNPRNNSAVLMESNLDEDNQEWSVNRGRVVSRTAADLAIAVAPLLRIASELIFVDPHFDPYKPRSRSALREYLRYIYTDRVGIQISRIEFHTQFNDRVGRFGEECNQRFCHLIPAGLRLKIVRWRERQDGDGLHNRYILSDRGGISLAWGLDEGTASQTDDLILLDDAIYQKRWAQYCSATPAFDLVDEYYVDGTR